MFNKELLDALVDIENKCFKTEGMSRRSLAYFYFKGHMITHKDKAYIAYIPYKKSIRIYSVAVSPEYQGKGIAKALVLEVCKLSNLVTLEAREELTKFYERLGFEKVKELPKYYADGATAWKMERKINN